jgi:2-polyprenyl-6-hydroxyphenyl methylase/3-demethylubiquinone-9 3-methyltransferase
MGKVEQGSAAVAADASVDLDEVEKFRGLAERWWDVDGPMRPLHRLNPCRIAWIRDQACRHLGRDARARRPLDGVPALDVGCGGGLLAEPLARLGARVTATDPATETIETAAWHAREAGIAVDYRVGTIEDLVLDRRRFTLVLALEVIEHTSDAEAFLAALAAATAPGGLLILSTLSRTWRAWLLGIVAAEHLLGWLPPGTHDWRRFVRPAEMARRLRALGMRPIALTGIAYDPARQEFRPDRDPSVNYMMAAAREAG